MSVSDSTGAIDAKIWSDAAWFDRSGAETDVLKLPEEEIKQLVGSTVGIDGKTAGVPRTTAI